MKATILLESQATTDSYDPSTFTAESDWSAKNSEGLNIELPSSQWCPNQEVSEQWHGSIHPDDTERRVHYMDVPEESSEIRLTDKQTEERWVFATDLITTATVEAVATPTIPETVYSEPEVVPLPEPEAFTPAPVAPPASAPAPVMGFTGAPGADPVRPLDKTISYCGDPSIHQTGTTFFTDGTTGWTEHCSALMLSQ